MVQKSDSVQYVGKADGCHSYKPSFAEGRLRLIGQ